MRISDWSSDVCSSDLLDHNVDIGMANHLHAVGGDQNIAAHQSARLFDITHGNRRDFDTAPRPAGDFLDVACQYLPGDRKRVVSGKSVSVSVVLGGRRLIQKKQKYHKPITHTRP